MTYDYICKKCGKKFEAIQSIKEDSLKKHSDVNKCKRTEEKSTCDGEVKRLISGGSGIIFKGTGWTRKRSGAMKKIDQALGDCGRFEDASDGWSHRED